MSVTGAGDRCGGRGPRSHRRTRARSLALAALTWCASGCGVSPAVDRPPVVIVIIDTLRADHLGCYGYPLDTSPRLDAFAETATLFEANATQCNATFASITSIFTGLYATTHGNFEPVPLRREASTGRESASLAERLRAAGYSTLAVVSHPAWRERPEGVALGRGWDAFSVIPPETPEDQRMRSACRADATNRRVFPLLDEAARTAPGAPLFLWAHYFDPHTPYDPPSHLRRRYAEHHRRALGLPLEQPPADPVLDETRPMLENLAAARALYDAEIRFCDEQVGLLFDRLRADGLWDDALVIVMADHGENMEAAGEDRGRINFGHKRLFEGVARTPLLVKRPGQAVGVRSSSLTQNIDVLPTVLELLGLPREPGIEGRSLVPLLDDASATVHDRIYMESSDSVEKAVKTEALKYIEPGKGGSPLLYRWREDPHETRDVFPGAPDALRAELSELLAPLRPARKPTVRVRLMPTGSPSTVRIDLELTKARIQRVQGPGTGPDPGRSRHLTREIALDDEPVDVVLELDRPRPEGRWHLQAPGVVERVRLGSRPLTESWAVPHYVPDGTPPAGPVLALDLGPEARSLVFTATLDPGALLELELHYATRGYGQTVEVVSASGFSPLEKRPDPPRFTARLAGPGGGRLELRRPAGAPELLPVARLDGRWPDPASLAIDGRGVSRDELGFTLLDDDRVRASLQAPPPEEGELPPGAIVIWTASEALASEIDAAALDPEMLEDLRALGYVK